MDITMCQDHECPKHGDCFRYKATTGKYWQAFATSPRKKDSCEYYWKFIKDPAIIQKKVTIRKGK